MSSYSAKGIVLARRDYAEADRILVIFSNKFGKLNLIAKGVRKPKSRKRGHLEVFAYIRFSFSSGKGLDILTEAEIIDDFNFVREDLRRVAVAYYFVEIVGRVTREGERNEQLFDLLLQYLKRLETSNLLRSLRHDFVENVLTLLGFWPKGEKIVDVDLAMEELIERKINSVRVGKKLLT